MAEEFVVTLIIFGILGVFVSGYLIRNRAKKQHTVCPIGGHCDEVLESKWSHVFGIKNDILGIVYYLFIVALAIYVYAFQQPYPFFATILTVLAFVFSVFLVYIQAYVIRQYCFYCLISALINLFILINVLIL